VESGRPAQPGPGARADGPLRDDARDDLTRQLFSDETVALDREVPMDSLTGYGVGMAAVEIDAYLTGLEDPQRATLDEMRRLILVLIPQAEQVISYRLPGFKLNGTMIAGLAAFARHNSYLPHSGSVLPALADELTAYTRSSCS
jgi:hypothetical protein